MPGTAVTSSMGICDLWFFRKCITFPRIPSTPSVTTPPDVPERPGYSPEIALIDCVEKYCPKPKNNQSECCPKPENGECDGRKDSAPVSSATKGTCQQCRDIEKCFTQKKGMASRTWDETLCPNGVVTPDYDDPSRIENTVFSEKVRIIEPFDMTVYIHSKGDATSEETQMLVGAGHLNLKPGDIVISAQAGGIFHKLHNVTHMSDFTMMWGTPATLTDAITYADFKGPVSVSKIDDDESLEQKPPVSLLDDIISGNAKLKVGTVVHDLDPLTVYKCLGRTYMTSEGDRDTSFYLVLVRDSSSNNHYQVGNIVWSKKSSGFLETVLGVWPTSMATLVNTTLTECNNLDTSKLKLSLPSGKAHFIGGDNNPGLFMFDINAQVNLDVGDVISGRESAGILAKVLKVHSTGSFIILEVTNIELVKDGSAITRLSVKDITDRRVVRRKRSEHTAKFTLLEGQFGGSEVRRMIVSIYI